jgi:cytoskeleton protein RodZ
VTRAEAEVSELPTEPGARLRRQREIAGLSEQQVAEQLNLDSGAVTAIERDDYAALGAPVFVRGHLKRYAALVGLPEDDVVGAYDRSRAQLAEPTLIPKSREEMRPERGPARWPWIVGSLALFLLAAGVAAYVSEHGLALPEWPFGRGKGTATAQDSVAAPTGTQSESPSTGALPVVASQVPSDAAASAALAGAPATNAPAGSVAQVPVQPGQVSLELRFAADSWVEIYDAAGKAVLYDLGKAGTQRTVSGAAPLSLTFGNAPAITLQANGRVVALPAPPAGQTVGRYSLGADGALR